MSKKYISTLSLDEHLMQLNITFKANPYIVVLVDKNNYLIKPNLLYRANYYGIISVLEGKTEYTVDNKNDFLKRHDILFTTSSQAFSVNYISDDYKALYIFFTEDFISQAGFNYRSYNMLINLQNSESNVIRKEPVVFKRVKFYLEELNRLATYDFYYQNEMVYHFFSLLMYEVANQLKKSIIAPSGTSREEDITITFFQLIRRHFKEQHDVQFYADQLFITRKYLSRILQKTMQKSPKEIISQVLIIEAKLILKKSDISINQLAAHLNFSDLAVFSKFFKKNTGKSPLEYKQSDLF